MKISQISIENYRSVGEEQVLDLSGLGGANCFILLGMNEAGKSNILRSIALLDPENNANYRLDCNVEAEDQGADIQLWFKLEIENRELLRSKLIASGLDKELAGSLKFQNVHRGVSFTTEGSSRWYSVNLAGELAKKTLERYLVVGEKIVPRTDEAEVRDAEGLVVNLATAANVEALARQSLQTDLDSDLPKVVVWRSEERYRISGPIDLRAFAQDPSISIPLGNCFRIAGFATQVEVKNKIESALDNARKMATLSQQLSDAVTAHINEVWGEHRISIKFHINGAMLSFLVEDKDHNVPKFEVEQRSDGFKHFISILLNLSAENKTNSLANKIILLDEPENHLHPSGQRYLRDELLKISKANVVIFATHSIFMVDTKHLNRHFSIKKENGKTKIVQIEKDNPYREEVLFEALGTSVLQLVQPNVVIFEGKTDRDAFEMYARKFSAELKPPKITPISADSVDAVIKYTKFFNNKIVKGFVLVDSDIDGKREKARILAEPGYTKKNTFEINDILDTGKDATLEDLFEGEILIGVIKEQFELEIDLDPKAPFISQIKQKLHEHKKAFREPERERMKQIFFERISRLTKGDLEAQPYFKFFDDLCKSIG